MTQRFSAVLDEKMQNGEVDHILDTAEQLARRGGYFSFQICDVAKASGIPELAIQAHFDSRQDLSVALVKRYTASLIRALGSPEQAKPLDHLINIWGHAARQDGQMCLCTLYGAEISALPPAVTKATRAYYQSVSTWIADALKCDHNDEHADAVLAILCGALLTVRSLDRPNDFEKIAHLLVQPVEASCSRANS